MNEEVKKKIQAAARFHVRESNECEVMDDYTSHEDTYKAGAQFGYSLLSEENARLKEKFELVHNALKRVMNSDLVTTAQFRDYSEAFDNAKEVMEQLRTDEMSAEKGK